MQVTDLINPTVQALFYALVANDQPAYLTLFAPDAIMTDDGHRRGVAEWSTSELFDNGHITPTRQSVDGLVIYGDLKSRKWGLLRVVFTFTVRNGQIQQFAATQQ